MRFVDHLVQAQLVVVVVTLQGSYLENFKQDLSGKLFLARTIIPVGHFTEFSQTSGFTAFVFFALPTNNHNIERAERESANYHFNSWATVFI